MEVIQLSLLHSTQRRLLMRFMTCPPLVVEEGAVIELRGLEKLAVD